MTLHTVLENNDFSCHSVTFTLHVVQTSIVFPQQENKIASEALSVGAA